MALTSRQVYFGAGGTDDEHVAEKVEIVEYLEGREAALDAVSDDLSKRIEAAGQGYRVAERWAVLSGEAGTVELQPAEVAREDTGTHIDPVSGLTVPNTGQYRWSTSPSGWRRVGDLIVADGALAGKDTVSTADMDPESVTASRRQLNDTMNLYPDFDMRDEAFYSSSTGAVFGFPNSSSQSHGARFLQIAASASAESMESEWFPVEVLTRYVFEGSAYSGTPAAGVTSTLEIEFGSVAAGGATITPTRRVLVGSRTGSSSAVRHSVAVETAANEKRARFVHSKDAVNGSSANSGGWTVLRVADARTIGSRAVRPSALTTREWQNLYPDPNMEDLSLYSATGGTIRIVASSAVRVSEYFVQIEATTAAVTARTPGWPVRVNEEYFAAGRVGWSAGAAVDASLYLDWYDSSALGSLLRSDLVGAYQGPASAFLQNRFLPPAMARWARYRVEKAAGAEASAVQIAELAAAIALGPNRLSTVMSGLPDRMEAAEDVLEGLAGALPRSDAADALIEAKLFRSELTRHIMPRITEAEAEAMTAAERQKHDRWEITDGDTPGIYHWSLLPSFAPAVFALHRADVDGADFDTGVSVVTEGPDIVTIRGRASEWGRRTHMAKLTGMNGRSPEFRVIFPASTTHLDAWRNCYSFDPAGDQWFRFDNEVIDLDNSRWVFSNDEPFDADTIYIAVAPRFTVARYDRKLSEWIANPLTRPTESAVEGYRIGTISSRTARNGKVVPAIDAFAFKIGTGERKFFLTSGVHTDEYPGHYCFEGAVNYLLGTSAKARRLREMFTFYVYPRINSQCLWAGLTREDIETQADMNRVWFMDDPALASELRALYEPIWSADAAGNFVGHIDYHSWNTLGDRGIWQRTDIAHETARAPFMAALAAYGELTTENNFVSQGTVSDAMRHVGRPLLVIVSEHLHNVTNGPDEWRAFGRDQMQALSDISPQAFPPPTQPVNVVPPKVVGSPEAGKTVYCSRGEWLGSPPGMLAYQAQIDGVDASSSGDSYECQSGDIGKALRFKVTSTNFAGSVTAYTDPVTITAAQTPTGGFALTDLFDGLHQGDAFLPQTSDLWQGSFTNPVTEDGQNVTVWEALSGSNRFSNTSEIPRPVYKNNGSAEWVEFDGSSRLFYFPVEARDLFRAKGAGFVSIAVETLTSLNTDGTNAFFIATTNESQSAARLLIGRWAGSLNLAISGRRLDTDNAGFVTAPSVESTGKFVLTGVINWEQGYQLLYKDHDLIAVNRNFLSPGLTSDTRSNVTVGGANSGLQSYYRNFGMAFGAFEPTPQQMHDMIHYLKSRPGMS